ncbi:hypothetical protein [Kamptonema formosum]|uniref:hypothetical protein n=1 Tax=Kamptonema formosum TaxID=331992 RepID=UPI0012DE0541|nr:hypothetical protein [Oscillatoria sp. PCC 10802]
MAQLVAIGFPTPLTGSQFPPPAPQGQASGLSRLSPGRGAAHPGQKVKFAWHSSHTVTLCQQDR